MSRMVNFVLHYTLLKFEYFLFFHKSALFHMLSYILMAHEKMLSNTFEQNNENC